MSSNWNFRRVNIKFDKKYCQKTFCYYIIAALKVTKICINIRVFDSNENKQKEDR